MRRRLILDTEKKQTYCCYDDKDNLLGMIHRNQDPKKWYVTPRGKQHCLCIKSAPIIWHSLEEAEDALIRYSQGETHE